tara:strand:- start:4446 stop:5525 length:1080 start_codon:yes stop_codon:yes gene_type:complete
MSLILEPIAKNIEHIVDALVTNTLTILPKDTVYNFVANIDDLTSQARIYELKQRNDTNPLTLNIAHFEMSAGYIDLNQIETTIIRSLVGEFWPGQLAIVCKSNAALLNKYITKDMCISIASPSNTYFKQILDTLQAPLVSTSANLSGQVSCTHINHIKRYFKTTKDLTILDNMVALPYGTEGTILKIENNMITILRQGYPSQNKIVSVLNAKGIDFELVVPITASITLPHGVSRSHYTINKNIKLVNFISYEESNTPESNKVEIMKATTAYLTKHIFIDFNKKNSHLANITHGYVDLSEVGDIREAIFNLYNVLHELSVLDCQNILIFNIFKSDIEFYTIMDDRVQKICDYINILIPCF